MGHRSTRHALHQLHALANAQCGFFTAKQAATLGYGYSHLAYHVKAGNIERAGHGVYRLITVPIADHDDLVRLSLWSRDRADRPQAVASHATALVLHGLTDLLPRAIHFTVPRRFQKPAPRGVVLHIALFEMNDVEAWDGFQVTKPLRTLIDVADAPDVPQAEFTKAAHIALDRGLVRREVLMQAAMQPASSTRFSLTIMDVCGTAE